MRNKAMLTLPIHFTLLFGMETEALEKAEPMPDEIDKKIYNLCLTMEEKGVRVMDNHITDNDPVGMVYWRSLVRVDPEKFELPADLETLLEHIRDHAEFHVKGEDGSRPGLLSVNPIDIAGMPVKTNAA